MTTTAPPSHSLPDEHAGSTVDAAVARKVKTRNRRWPAKTAAAVEGGGWWTARLAFRHPVISGAVLLGVPAFTAVTVWEEAICLGVPLGGAIFGGPARRKSALSLPKITKSARRQRRFKASWHRIMSDAGLVKSAKVTGRERYPRLSRVRMTPAGLSATVDTSSIALPPEKLAEVASRIKAASRAATVKIEPTAGHLAVVRLFWRDPLNRVIHVRDLPPAQRPIAPVVGIDDDGVGLAKDLSTSQLIIGETGSGKSSELWVILDGLRRSRMPIRLRAMDPKGGQELGVLADVAYEYEYNALRFPTLLDHQVTALEARQAQLRRDGVRKLDTFTRDIPLDLLIIDEFMAVATLMKRSDKTWKKAAEQFEVLLSQGRAAGFVVVALAQNGKLNVLGEARDLFPNRAILRVNSDSMVPVVLNASAEVYPAHRIKRPGEGYYVEAGKPVRRYRSAFMSDAEIERVVRWLGRTQSQRSERAS